MVIMIHGRLLTGKDATVRNKGRQIHSFIHSFILAISIAPLQVLYLSEALPTTARILYRSFTPKREILINIRRILITKRFEENQRRSSEEFCVVKLRSDSSIAYKVFI